MKLIDADALLEAMKDRVVIEPKYGNWIYEASMIDLITNAPTVQREGWVSVPIEPTEEMIQDGYTALMEWDARTGEDIGIGDVYKAMIQAAPKE